MRVGEAFEKVTREISQTIQRDTGLDPEGINDLSLEDLRKLTEVNGALTPYLYDGAVRDFITSRAKKRAQAMIDDAIAKGLEFTPEEIVRTVDVMTDDLVDQWHQDMLQMFALAYSFADPAFADVEHDKDGFVQLCREVDRDLISIQVAQFASDTLLRDIIGQRIVLAANFTSQMFAQIGKPQTKFGLRDWFFQVWATVALNCFVAGHLVRKLLEEEAAFEAMMKETD